MNLTGFALRNHLAELSVGQLAALTWLTEVVAANRVSTKRSVAILDFDEFLQQPEDRLGEVCRQLGLQAEPEACRKAIAGSIMRSYSKAPEHTYDADLRHKVIAQSRTRNSTEIESGKRWIERCAAGNAEVTAAVNTLTSG